MPYVTKRQTLYNHNPPVKRICVETTLHKDNFRVHLVLDFNGPSVYGVTEDEQLISFRINFTERPLYAGTTFHKDLFTLGPLVTKTSLRWDYFSQRPLYYGTTFHKDLFTPGPLFTKTSLRWDYFSQRPLHARTTFHKDLFTLGEGGGRPLNTDR